MADDLLGSHSSPHAEAAEIVRAISLAVAHLHHLNIAHRDLKVLWVSEGHTGISLKPCKWQDEGIGVCIAVYGKTAAEGIETQA